MHAREDKPPLCWEARLYKDLPFTGCNFFGGWEAADYVDHEIAAARYVRVTAHWHEGELYLEPPEVDFGVVSSVGERIAGVGFVKHGKLEIIAPVDCHAVTNRGEIKVVYDDGHICGHGQYTWRYCATSEKLGQYRYRYDDGCLPST
jgi:hypothetical protein